MAIITFVPAGLYAIYAVFYPSKFSVAFEIIGFGDAVCCVITVYCTAMIYASLKTVHAWSNWRVPLGYLLLGLTTGGVFLTCLLSVWGYKDRSLGFTTIILLFISAVWKCSYWRFIDTSMSASSPESATGLGEFGKVRQFEAPHNEDNYLIREMGFRVARKHGRRLRQLVFLMAFSPQ